MSPAQSRCPASLQKLELQIHNSSGTPWLFASCCEQMEELQIKPSAAREPIAFPTQPRRQQQRQRRKKKNKKNKKLEGKKKKKRQKERERSQPFLQGLSCHLSTPTCEERGLSAGSGPFPGTWPRGALSHHPGLLGGGRQRESGVTLARQRAATRGESRLLTLIGAGSACTRFGPRGGIKGEKLTSVVERTRSPLVQGSRQSIFWVLLTPP